MKKVIFSAVTAMFLLTSTVAEAHPGRLDELGGHFRRADCTYHFHKMTSLASGKSKKQLVQLIKRYNSNNKCTSSLTEAAIEL